MRRAKLVGITVLALFIAIVVLQNTEMRLIKFGSTEACR
jgi:hypothetical protein